ncbi:MAG: hypothetical protein OEM81_02665 [Acidimicrobiia bacterium]|nr:hypothetical protein [Acidimicrobiia bacterium]MDH3396717.1 hypothetical protein [Acidimicrobiia bacterium]
MANDSASTGGENKPKAVRVGAVGILIGLLAMCVTLAIHRWDPAGPLMVGVEAPLRPYVEERLGDIPLTDGTGHDGKYFFVQAHDPWLLAPSENAALMERPTYRSQRMLYPLIASLGAGLGEDGILWLMLLINVLAMGVGTWATAAVAQSAGASRWFGLAFALNPGILFELAFDGSGVVAWALVMVAIHASLRRRWIGAGLALCGAVLAREVMYLPVVGMAIYFWSRERSRAVAMLAAPLLVLGSWGWWVRRQLDVPLSTLESNEIGLPLVGLGEAIRVWLQLPGLRLVVGVLVLAVVVVAIRQILARRDLIALIGIGLAVVAIFLRGAVWFNYYDNTRAVAPLFTTIVLVWAIRRQTARTESLHE